MEVVGVCISAGTFRSGNFSN